MCLSCHVVLFPRRRRPGDTPLVICVRPIVVRGCRDQEHDCKIEGYIAAEVVLADRIAGLVYSEAT